MDFDEELVIPLKHQHLLFFSLFLFFGIKYKHIYSKSPYNPCELSNCHLQPLSLSLFVVGTLVNKLEDHLTTPLFLFSWVTPISIIAKQKNNASKALWGKAYPKFSSNFKLIQIPSGKTFNNVWVWFITLFCFVISRNLGWRRHTTEKCTCNQACPWYFKSLCEN